MSTRSAGASPYSRARTVVFAKRTQILPTSEPGGHVTVPQWTQDYFTAWNDRDGETVAGFMAEDVVDEDLGLGQVFTGRDAITRVDETAACSFDDVFYAGRRVRVRRRPCRGMGNAATNTGAAGGMPATGKPCTVRGASVGHLDEQGKIPRHRDYRNMADHLMHVGLLPPRSAG